MDKITRDVKIGEERDKISLFYLERVLEQVEANCFLVAQKNFELYKHEFQRLIQVEHFQYLVNRISCNDDWSIQKEKKWFERLTNAVTFSEYKTVHDLAHEILLHHQHSADSCDTHSVCDAVNSYLAKNNGLYLEPDEVEINTFIDARIDFVVDRRRARKSELTYLQGNPGFHLSDTLGKNYRCFVKQVQDAQVEDELKLKITNIPGITLTTRGITEPIIYLEPRVVPGEIIEVELIHLSHTGNSFTFRHHSYDGFLWFKRRGVNKEIFNKNTLRPKDRVLAKVLYTTEEVKRASNGNITRLGIVKAIPLKRAEGQSNQEGDQDTDAARALN